MSNKGIFRGWDPSSQAGRRGGGTGYAVGDRDIVGTMSEFRRATNDELIYTPVPVHYFLGTAGVVAKTADQLPTNTSYPLRTGPFLLPEDGSVVAVSVVAAVNQTTVGTPTFFVYDYDGSNVDGGAIVEGIRMYTGKVASHYTSLHYPFVRTGGRNNLLFKYAVDWSAGTFNTHAYITGYWTRLK